MSSRNDQDEDSTRDQYNSDESISRQEISQQQNGIVEQVRDQLEEVRNRPTAMAEIKRTVAIFSLVGFGMGTSGYLIAGMFMSSISSSAASQIGQVLGQIFGVIIQFIVIISIALIGSPVAAIQGYTVSQRFDEGRKLQYSTTAIGCFIGNILLMLIAIGIITQQGALNTASSGGSGGDGGILGGMLSTILLISLFVALIGVASNYVSQNFVAQTTSRRSTTGVVDNDDY